MVGRGYRSALPVIIAAVVALAVVGGAALVWFQRPAPGAAQSPAALAGTDVISTPQDAVRGFLGAVAGAQADVALSYLSVAPTDRTFITDEVLARSAELAPLTAIDIADASDYRHEQAAIIAVKYKLGDLDESGLYCLSREGDDWVIETALPELYLSTHVTAGVGMTLNGVPLDGLDLAHGFPALPGTYQFAMASPYLEPVTPTFTVAETDRLDLVDGTGNLRWAADAPAKLTAAAEAALEACLDATADVPAGCGYAKPASKVGTNPSRTKVVSTLADGDLTAVAWNLGDPPVSAAADLALSIDVELNDPVGDNFTKTVDLTHVEIDLSEPGTPVVSFS